jgi:hypothetical protein
LMSCCSALNASIFLRQLRESKFTTASVIVGTMRLQADSRRDDCRVCRLPRRLCSVLRW